MAIKNILCVDDMSVELDNLKGILTAEGYKVSTASSGKAALELIAAKGKPDLIFMDIVMPDGDGFTACRKLANDQATKDIPVVFLSSKGEKADMVWAQLQGGKAYITKPYNKQAILDEIRKLDR